MPKHTDIDDDDILIEDEIEEEIETEDASVDDVVLVAPGVYIASCLGARRVSRFGRSSAEFVWRVTSETLELSAHLPGYCPLRKGRRQPRASKYSSWQRAIGIYTGQSPSSVTLRSFRFFVYRVQVETVEYDHRQRKLRPRDQYSKVSDIIEVIGRLSAQKDHCA